MGAKGCTVMLVKVLLLSAALSSSLTTPTALVLARAEVELESSSGTPAEQPTAPHAASGGAGGARSGDAKGPACPSGPPCRPRPKAAPCAEAEHPGGAWTSLNGNTRNTRSQPAETRVGVEQAPDLRPAWSFSGSQVGAPGGMRSTPVVAGGCVFLALGQGYLGDRGDVVALDTDTGEVVWHTRLEGSVLGLAVANGLVYATPSLGTRGEVAMPVVTDSYSPAGSYAVALDASTGRLRWRSDRLDDGSPRNGTFINASPVVFETRGRSMVFVPLAGGSGDGARVPMYFLDALDGSTIRRSLALTDGEYEAGFGGPGIWSTAAYDEATGHLYAGTADSEGHTRQHPYNNAIVRIDADPRRPTFGTVVGAYQGTSEHADLDPLIGYPNNPLCGALGPTGTKPPTFFDTSASTECLELDYDFGASPNLYTDAKGDLVVAALQKSGIFHAVKAADMKAKWKLFVGPGGPVMHAATAAVGDGLLHVGATPNLLLGLGPDDGALRWASTTGADMFAYQPLTIAGGVLYGINDLGQLVGFDAARGGVPLLQRSLADDGGFMQCLGVGAGVAVAANTVFVPCDAGGPVDLARIHAGSGGLVAYRLP